MPVFAQGIPLWSTLPTDPFLWLLCTNAWTPNQATDVHRDDISAYEPTDGSYAAQSLVGGIETVAGGNTSVSYTADDVLFPALAGGDILTWAVLVSDTGSPATDVILAAWPIVRITDGSDVPLTITTSLIQFPVT